MTTEKIYTEQLKGSSGVTWAFQVVLVVKNPPANTGDIRDIGSIPGSGRFPWRRKCSPVFLPGESHGQRSLGGTVHEVAKSQSNLAHYSHMARC